jgi:hypothetical protein
MANKPKPPPAKAFPHYTPNEELDNILHQAEDGVFFAQPQHLFTAIAASLVKRGLANHEMYRLYEKIGPLLKERAHAPGAAVPDPVHPVARAA